MIKYVNFDLEAFGYRQTESADLFNVRVADSPVGEQKIARAEKVRLPRSVRDKAFALRRRQLSLDEIIAFGYELGQALFPPSVYHYFQSSLYRLGDDEGLRIRLKLDTYGLAELPWEYIYLPLPDAPKDRRGPEGFLALNRRISLVRYESQEGTRVAITAGAGPLHLVALLSSPDDPNYEKLDLRRERASIEKALAGLAAVRPEFYPEPTPDTLLDALVNGADIFHFAGHGEFKGDLGDRYGSQEGAGAVILVAEDGRARPFSAQLLAGNLMGRGVRLAVLTACEVGQQDAASAWAGVVTALTHAGIPAVVGMQFRVRDGNATAFSRAFYRALAAGQPIDAAVTDGRFAILNRADYDERDWGVPVLYLRADDDNGVLFPQADRPAAKTPVEAGAILPEIARSLPSPPAGGEKSPPPAVEPEAAPVAKTVKPPTAMIDKRKLREAIVKAYSVDELEVLCADIQSSLADKGIDLMLNLDVIEGEGKTIKTLNLIEFMDRRGYLGYLVDAVREGRPGII